MNQVYEATLQFQIYLMLILVFWGFVISTVKGYGYQGSALWGETSAWFHAGMQNKLLSILFTVLLFAFITLLPLAFTDVYRNSVIPFHLAKKIVFILDILCITKLIRLTGGSIASPFNPALFLLPSLAMFLKESLTMIIVYIALILFSFVINFLGLSRFPDEFLNHPRIKLAYGGVTIFCFILSTYIGFTTV